jgi:hypothetical protein
VSESFSRDLIEWERMKIDNESTDVKFSSPENLRDFLLSPHSLSHVHLLV